MILAALASYIAVDHELYRQANRGLAQELQKLYGHLDNPGAIPLIASHDGQYQAQLLGPDGQVLVPAYPGPLPVGSIGHRMASTRLQGAANIRTVDVGGSPVRLLTFSLGSGDGALQVAAPFSDAEHALATLQAILIVVTLAGIALAVGLGLIVARATLRPVERLTKAAEHVAATQDLGATIEVEGADELGRLAYSFNAMLGALDQSRQQQAQLVADAGHELRTPLTSLRTNIEVLMRAQQLPENERVDLLSDVHGQLEELTTLVGDLVELARHDEQAPEPIDVRLDIIVERALERARRRAPSLTFVTSIDEGLVRAQPALLERAVLNVLDNAVKWSPPGGPIEVRLSAGDRLAAEGLPGSFPTYQRSSTTGTRRWSLDVRDHGPGIAAEDLPHVFDRFYRAPTARALPGSGLGLAIVWRVVTTNGGTVRVETPATGGTLVHIELPLVEPDDIEPDDTDPDNTEPGRGAPREEWSPAEAALWPPPDGLAAPLGIPPGGSGSARGGI